MHYREIKVTHSGGFGLGWIAIAIVIFTVMGLYGVWKRVDCSLGIERACTYIEQIYIDKETQELQNLKELEALKNE